MCSRTNNLGFDPKAPMIDFLFKNPAVRGMNRRVQTNYCDYFSLVCLMWTNASKYFHVILNSVTLLLLYNHSHVFNIVITSVVHSYGFLGNTNLVLESVPKRNQNYFLTAIFFFTKQQQ